MTAPRSFKWSGNWTDRVASCPPGARAELVMPENCRKLTAVIVRLPNSMVAQIDAFGGDRYLHRSERIRGLLTAGLQSENASHG